jgi:hypothetical protein
MATVIKVDGTVATVEPKARHFSLEELQGFVGGYIEIIQLHDGRAMVLNEEGKLEGLPFNAEATGLARLAGIATNDYIVGNVIVCEVDGEELV